MLECELSIQPPLHLRHTLGSLGVGSFDDRGVWWWAAATDDAVSTIAIERTPSGVRGRAWGDRPEELIGRLGRLVGYDDEGLDVPPTSAARPYLDAVRGMRLGSTGDVHAALVHAVLGQVVTTAEAKMSLRQLVRSWGPEAPGPRMDLRAIPPPAAIARLSYDDLHTVGVERRRASVLIEVARRSRRLAETVDMPVAAAEERLLAVRGVGPWTAAMVLGSALGDRDAVPVGDYHIPHTVAWALAAEPRGTDERMLELLEPYRPQRRRVITALKMAGVHAPRYGPRTSIRTHL